MNNKIVTGALVIVVVGIVGFMALGANSNSGNNSGSVSESNGILTTVYKSPSCGCCGVFATYMKGEGYDVQVEDVADMSTIKQELGVPQELGSCHTTEIDGYVVEGHIPEEAIAKLLEERPDIKGIGMPGMPSGSPGMPGPKNEEFVIYEINNDGTKGEVFMTI